MLRRQSSSLPTVIRPNKGNTSSIDTKNPVFGDFTEDDVQLSPPSLESDDEEAQSYGIALFDYDSLLVDNLNLSVLMKFGILNFFLLEVNDKIILIKQIDDDWTYGRNLQG